MLISQKIFSLIKQRGMTQKEFSERTEISQSTISDWKRKGTNPSADKILKICEVLQVTPYELLAENNSVNEILQVVPDVILNHEEDFLVESFRKLDIKQKNRVLGYLEAMKEIPDKG
ncbi:helix-turn-helix domain-containing protein [uncultured Eubacterium sp.]|uniref:helix-turn-helix domain-containing protein n=1 Tax=uncultured Eubacterium sp. TaxID=165185 RepID=UPI0025F84FC5|nr:helix-turn-helix transcriptional regulator [uncultured Eubacterium sp.]